MKNGIRREEVRKRNTQIVDSATLEKNDTILKVDTYSVECDHDFPIENAIEIACTTHFLYLHYILIVFSLKLSKRICTYNEKETCKAMNCLGLQHSKYAGSIQTQL